MSNIMINEVCNLSCPYCFAESYLNNDNSKDITLKNFKDIVKFISKSENTKKLGIIGGEPLLHPLFDEIIKAGSDIFLKGRPDRHIVLFTNGINIDKHIDILVKHKIQILVNVNSPYDIGEKAYLKIKENVRLARLKGLNLTLGVNFYKPDFDTSFIEELLYECSFPSLRIGIPAPNDKEKRATGSVEYISSLKKPLISFFKRLLEHRVIPSIDCQPFPICLLDKEELEYFKEQNNKYSCEIFSTKPTCVPVLDFLQDKTVVRCFGCSDNNLKLKMEDFVRYEDIENYFKTNIDNIGYLIPSTNRCTDCYLRKTQMCQAGCLSYKIPVILHEMAHLNKTFCTEF